jgi:acyl-CoA reductase-like NAD-dependent aldehyde dehydrogenase
MAPSAVSPTTEKFDTDNTVPGVLKWDTFHNIIDGKLVSTRTTRHSINPATGAPNPEVPVSTQDDVEAAMQAAKKAFQSWADTSMFKRRAALLAFSNALETEQELFAEFLVREQGKPVSKL